MITKGDILGSWINNMDSEEKELYIGITDAYREMGLLWNFHNDFEFASIADTAYRKEVMKGYLDRLNHRLASPVRPRPDGWSI